MFDFGVGVFILNVFIQTGLIAIPFAAIDALFRYFDGPGPIGMHVFGMGVKAANVIARFAAFIANIMIDRIMTM